MRLQKHAFHSNWRYFLMHSWKKVAPHRGSDHRHFPQLRQPAWNSYLGASYHWRCAVSGWRCGCWGSTRTLVQPSTLPLLVTDHLSYGQWRPQVTWGRPRMWAWFSNSKCLLISAVTGMFLVPLLRTLTGSEIATERQREKRFSSQQLCVIEVVLDSRYPCSDLSRVEILGPIFACEERTFSSIFWNRGWQVPLLLRFLFEFFKLQLAHP